MTRIDHAAVWVADLEAARDFYTTWFGELQVSSTTTLARACPPTSSPSGRRLPEPAHDPPGRDGPGNGGLSGVGAHLLRSGGPARRGRPGPAGA